MSLYFTNTRKCKILNFSDFYVKIILLFERLYYICINLITHNTHNMKQLIKKHVNDYFSNNCDQYLINCIENNERYETVIGYAISHRNKILNNLESDNDYINFFKDCDISYQRMIDMIADEIVNHVNNLWN